MEPLMVRCQGWGESDVRGLFAADGDALARRIDKVAVFSSMVPVCGTPHPRVGAVSPVGGERTLAVGVHCHRGRSRKIR